MLFSLVLLTSAVSLFVLFFFTLIRSHITHYRHLVKFGGPYDPIYLLSIFTFIYNGAKTVLAGGDFYCSLFDQICTYSEKFKPHFVLYTGLQANVVVCRAEEIESVMSHSENISKPYIVYDMLFPWLRKGLLTSTGLKWKSRRKMLTPTFHFSILDSFVKVMNKHSKEFAEKFSKRDPLIESNVVPHVERLTLNIICQTVMGVNLDTYDQRAATQYLKAIKRVGELFLIRIVALHQWPEWFYQFTPSGKEMFQQVDILHKFSEQVIQDRKEYFRNDSEKLRHLLGDSEENIVKTGKNPFLDLLLKEHFKDPLNFKLEDIREEVDTFMFEGHDTTAMALSYALFLLGHHPDVQQKIQHEIDEIIGDNNHDDDDLSIDQIKALKYLDCAVKECLRLYPSVPIVGRKITKEYQLGGKTVPAGNNVYCFFYKLHRDEKYFPQPEKFDPDRFLPENSKGRHPYAFLPFSAGPRNCIGQKFALFEMKIVLVWLLKNYSLKSLIPRDQLQIYTEMILRSKNGIPVECVPR